MKKMKKISAGLSVLLCALLLFGCGKTEAPVATPTPEAAATVQETPEAAVQETPEAQPWRETYAAVVEDWTRIDQCEEMENNYARWYFSRDGEEDQFLFHRYCLTDIDGNGTPELLLYSDTMRLTFVFTYDGGPVYLCETALYGVNYDTAELIVYGHWHGAGGSYENEWSGIQVQGDTVNWSSFYIDRYDATEDWDARYAFLDGETGEWQDYAAGEEYAARYEAVYAEHVEPCKPFGEFTLYPLGDPSGLDVIQ